MKTEKPPIFQNPQADGSSFLWKGSSTTGVLLLHGFTATTVEVRSFAQKLNMDGFTVLGKLLPGHGESPRDLNSVRWQDWYECAEAGLSELKHQCSTVFVAGESMGGLLSILLAANHAELAGVLLFAPALIIHNLWQSRFLWPFKEFIYKKRVDLTSPWQGFNVVPLHAGMELCKLQRKARKILPDISIPLIIFQGKRDQTIDAMGSIEVLEKTNSDDKQLIWLEESSHCILLDDQFKDAYPIAREFIITHTR